MTEAKQPTQEQIKEFWGWCGFKFGVKGSFTYGYIKYPNSDDLGETLPPIDLNNLFKYAVPKVDGVFKYDLDRGRHTWLIVLVMKPDVLIVGESEDPALALFWALWQVKVNND